MTSIVRKSDEKKVARNLTQMRLFFVQDTPRKIYSHRSRQARLRHGTVPVFPIGDSSGQGTVKISRRWAGQMA
jgi:hypothetical protein